MKSSSQSKNERPLVTFALFAYNQEEFIREAVESALAQDYTPLEIILSDDCSSDLTYDLIKGMVNDYSGDAELIVRQNEKNIGLAGHINEVLRSSKGDLIVVAAGDDLSAPSRTSTLVKHWIEQNKPAAMFSDVSVIDEIGQTISARYHHYDGKIPRGSESDEKIIKDLILRDANVLLGCSEAWSRQIFEKLGPLNDDVVNEDNALSFRSWILGGIFYLNETLVSYRVHGKNLAHRKSETLTTPQDFKTRERQLAKNSIRALAFVGQYRTDLQRIEKLNILSQSQTQKYNAWIDARLDNEGLRGFWWELSFCQRASAILINVGNFRFVVWGVPRIFGIDAYSTIRSCISLCFRRLKRLRHTMIEGRLG